MKSAWNIAVFIDDTLSALYYSTMNFKAFLIISIVFSLGACAHRTPPVSNDEAVVSDTIADDTQEAIDIAKEVVQSDIESAAIIDTALVSSADEETNLNNDLLQRIREGFTFPEFSSKTVKSQEHWH